MDGGLTDLRINNSILFFLVFFYNIYDQVMKHQNLLERASYTLPFLILSILCLIIKSRKFLAATYIVIGTGMILSPDNSNMVVLAACSIFVAAAGVIEHKGFSIFIVVITIVLISIRSFQSDFSIRNIILLFAGCYFIYSIFYIIFFKQKKSTISGKIEILTDEENQLLQLICSGYTQKEAGYELGHTDKWVTNRSIRAIKNKLGKDSLYEIIAIFSCKK